MRFQVILLVAMLVVVSSCKRKPKPEYSVSGQLMQTDSVGHKTPLGNVDVFLVLSSPTSGWLGVKYSDTVRVDANGNFALVYEGLRNGMWEIVDLTVEEENTRSRTFCTLIPGCSLKDTVYYDAGADSTMWFQQGECIE